MLDKLLLYLRIVHSVDYYNTSEYLNEDEMPNRCGIIHVRGPIPPNRVTHREGSLGRHQGGSRLIPPWGWGVSFCPGGGWWLGQCFHREGRASTWCLASPGGALGSRAGQAQPPGLSHGEGSWLFCPRGCGAVYALGCEAYPTSSD